LKQSSKLFSFYFSEDFSEDEDMHFASEKKSSEHSKPPLPPTATTAAATTTPSYRRALSEGSGVIFNMQFRKRLTRS